MVDKDKATFTFIGIHDELLSKASVRFIAPVTVLKTNSALDIQPKQIFHGTTMFSAKILENFRFYSIVE